MRNSSRELKWWLILTLFSLLLAACSASVADDADQADESAEAAADVADDLSPTPTESTSLEEPDLGLDSSANSEEAASESQADLDVQPDSTDSSVGESADSDGPGSGVDILTIDDRTDLLRQVTSEWETDFTLHTVPYNEIVPVLFRDGIRSLDQPAFVSSEEADEWLPGSDPVIAVELEGESRAYPLRIMAAHEIVNDHFGDFPVVITYCPLCNSALVFNSLFDGKALQFGTTGLLRKSDLIMYDRTSETLWQQFTGEGIVGEYAGERLEFLASSIVSFDDYRSAFRAGKVLSQDTGFGFAYSLASY